MHYPVWNLFFVWTLIILVGTVGKAIFHSECSEESWLSRAWDIFQTFVFITFTRLFFRSGSNLDPALANEQAWNTAKNMVNQIGGHWDVALVPAMAWQHRAVLLLFVIGMIIHWLPERFKRRYRLAFASLPLFWMAVVVVVIIVFFFQFITADLQSFIYFQF
jgi:surface polysaccharide O-acyltransferase-like enzyme